MKCNAKTEVYSRVVGYFRPVANWNRGKREEFSDRKPYSVPTPAEAVLPVDAPEQAQPCSTCVQCRAA